MAHVAQEVFDLYATRPNVAVLMSGQGTNALSILESEEIRDLYSISTVVTDNPSSNASIISEYYGLDLLEAPASGLNAATRATYFDELADALAARNIHATFYAGFMKVSTQDFCERFPGVNVHPADLSVIGADGLPKYRGMDALGLMRGELGFVRASVHVIDTPVDSGLAIALSDALYPTPGQSDAELHTALQAHEHVVYPKTLELLGNGLISIDKTPLVVATSGAIDE
jgi:phosphoribosylglycinamide formyltransferase 1